VVIVSFLRCGILRCRILLSLAATVALSPNRDNGNDSADECE
jgi:hypothetical protein